MNELLLNAVDPLHQWLLGLGDIGALIWIILKILVIAVPVIISVAFYVVWERKLIGWMHVRHGPMYVGMGIFQPSPTSSSCCSRKWSSRAAPTRRSICWPR